MLICLRVKIGLSGFAGMVVAGALADELLVPACKGNWISKRVIVCQHWSPHSGHWGTHRPCWSTIHYLLCISREIYLPLHHVCFHHWLWRGRCWTRGRGALLGIQYEIHTRYLSTLFLKTLKREQHIFQTNFQPGLGTRAVSSAFSSHLWDCWQSALGSALTPWILEGEKNINHMIRIHQR